jgi:tetratricopeptide (TPR) repeat protein
MDIQPGSRIGRIRIDALVGSGGMGAVYRGWDERLERAVAVKVIHADHRVSAFARARFLREARVLSKLDAPNICRIYDVIERDEGDCLVLELIEGKTLRGLLPSMERAESLRIGLAIARVLVLAHDRNIIHRDLKPENVMLTPAGEIKVLDFGLARAIGHDSDATSDELDFDEGADGEQTLLIGDDSATHTSVGSVVGTLHYMSPEQARGRPLTDASDIYALGIVMREMLGRGASAYGDAAGVALLERVRKGDVEPFAGGDRSLARLLRRMLAKEPGDRPRAADVVRALESIAARPARRRRRLIAGGAALLFALVAGGLAVVGERFLANRALFGSRHGGKIAVLPFRNATHDASLQWVELGMMDFVARSLGDTKGLSVVPSEDVIKAMKNLDLARGSLLTEPQRGKLLDALGADALIDAGVESQEGIFTIRYAPLTKGHAETPREIRGTELPQTANELARRLARRLDPTVNPVDIRERYSFDAFANVAYAIGLQQLNTAGPAVAAPYFAVCLDRDPDFLWAKLQLAECRRRSGGTEESTKLMAEVVEQSRRKHDDKLLASALNKTAIGEYDRGDTAGAVRHATEAAAIERRLGNEKALGADLNLLGLVALTRNDLEGGQARFTEALAHFRAVRSPRQEGAAMNNLGIIAERRQDFPTATKQCEAALRTAVAIGDRSLESTALSNLGRYAEHDRDLGKAEAYQRRNLAIAREIGDHHNEAIALTNLLALLFNAGRDKESEPLTVRALELGREMRDPRVIVINLSNLVIIHTKRGNLSAAAPPLEEARQLAGTLNDPVTRAYAELAAVYFESRRGRLAEAERSLADAEKIQINGQTLAGRARIAYERGNYPSAVSLIESAKARNDGWSGYEQSLEQAVAASAAAKRKIPLAWEAAVK